MTTLKWGFFLLANGRRLLASAKYSVSLQYNELDIDQANTVVAQGAGMVGEEIEHFTRAKVSVVESFDFVHSSSITNKSEGSMTHLLIIVVAVVAILFVMAVAVMLYKYPRKSRKRVMLKMGNVQSSLLDSMPDDVTDPQVSFQ